MRLFHDYDLLSIKHSGKRPICTEYNSIIEENIVVKLSDKSDQDKLLGIQIDLKYEKG